MGFTLKRGDKGEEVRLMQKGLAIFGKNINSITSFDGNFGPGTEMGLKVYQSQNGLATTGLYDTDTQALLGPNIDYMFIRLAEMDDYADELQVEPAALKAVYEVESKGDGFLPNGKCIILYEGHIFYRLYEKAYGTTKVRQIAQQYPSIVYSGWTKQHYLGGAREHQRLDMAKRIHPEIALQSASWGLFQIMGFNYTYADYTNVTQFADAMSRSEHEQFYMGTAFIRGNARMLQALRNKDWHTFARLYNGPGYAANNYHTKLAASYAKNKRLERA